MILAIPKDVIIQISILFLGDQTVLFHPDTVCVMNFPQLKILMHNHNFGDPTNTVKDTSKSLKYFSFFFFLTVGNQSILISSAMLLVFCRIISGTSFIDYQESVSRDHLELIASWPEIWQQQAGQQQAGQLGVTEGDRLINEICQRKNSLLTEML